MKISQRSALIALSVLGSLFVQGCGAGGNSSPAVKVAPDPAEVWATAAPAAVGMNADTLQKAASELPPGHGLSGMIVLRQGKAVLEQYWGGYDKDTMHDMRSATKTITSLMVGMAIDKKTLTGVDEPIKTQLETSYRTTPALAHGIALKDLLTMSSGLACNDRESSSPGNEENMYPKPDWINFFLSLPKAAAPGTQTFYCTAGVVTLGRIVSESSKMSIQDYSTRNLFAPLGIINSRWATFDGGRQTDTGGHLYLRPRDMAKIGQLVLQGGKWNGAQLVSQEWIAKSTSQHTIIDGNRKYGYLWWIDSYKVGSKTYNAHMARGNGGQYIIVVPELEMVVVFTGENYNAPAQQRPFEVLVNYILPAAS